MIKILANDGIDPIGKEMLEKAGFQVDTQNIPQEELALRLDEYDAVTVRSATKIRRELIDACPNLKLIGRGGVGMDNIDVEHARMKGITVVNTPASSSLSVAELVFAHLFGGVRFLYDANRQLPLQGATNFAGLKKKYAKGSELHGKTLGILGFGRIGREVAKLAFGAGMDVIAYDLYEFSPEVELHLANDTRVSMRVKTASKEELLRNSDFVTVHVPAQSGGLPALGKAEFDMMKDGAALVNCARGGVLDEEALIAALDSGKLSFAGLDVFDGEPTPSQKILSHPKISLSPHIGAATGEAQERIGVELANLIIDFFKK
ncbi:MAG TPA: D-2-hydroxyacid dehydrogenase [Anseongella sp.]|nr:D-2-hydroxyacid dehydrogenase [Anseongella sp.]